MRLLVVTFRMQDKLWGAEGGSSCREERVFEGVRPSESPPPISFFSRQDGGRKERKGRREERKERRQGGKEGRKE